MVDLHTHILPNIDDGAGSLQEALNMAAVLLEQRFETVVCTPHFDPYQMKLSDFILVRKSSMDLLQESMDILRESMGSLLAIDSSLIKDSSKTTDSKLNMVSSSTSGLVLIPGSETRFHEGLKFYSDLSPLCIGNTKYLLLELPFWKKWNNRLFDDLESFIKQQGLHPIIAHIERYPAVKLRWIRRLRELGCLLQLNADSVLDWKRKRRSLRYIKRGYIDVLASDCHNMSSRPPRLEQAYQSLERHIKVDCIKTLQQNAELISRGEALKEASDYFILGKG